MILNIEQNYHNERFEQMSKFIPANQELASNFVNKLSNTLFRDPEVFIEMFNTGLINRKNSDVVAIADELLTVFKGIERKGDKITFLDQGEVAVEDLFIKIEAYKVALQMKRVLSAGVAAGELQLENEIYFDGKGGVLLVDGNSSVSKEKVAKLSDKAYVALGQILNIADFNTEVIATVQDFVNVDASPIINASQVIG